MSVNSEANELVSTRRTAAFLRRLALSGAITDRQADLLSHGWLNLDNWSSHPWFRSVGEHTRATIEQFCQNNPLDSRKS